MKTFKFLQIPKEPRVQPSLLKLKDIHNRNKTMIVLWLEYPYDGDDSNIKTFEGNILQFYHYIRALQITPTVYEIYKECRGYFNTSIVYGNQNRHNQFILRKFKLLIRYTV